MKFKNIIFFFILIFLSAVSEIHAEEKNKKISIMCSLFPVYDFAREIAGDFADVRLLLRPETEPHEFEPSPLDIKKLNDSDIFIFTGGAMEAWAEKISHSLDNVIIIDASENIKLVNNDPHIWLDLNSAQKIIANISEGLCRADKKNSENYRKNAENFSSKISALDKKFMELKKNRALVFAGEFSCGYFVRRYGFDFVSAYDGENEPSVKRVVEILKYIREHNTKYIFSDALGISNITRSISEQTGTEILIFNSAHNVSSKAFKNGITFLEIMNLNYDAVKLALE